MNCCKIVLAIAFAGLVGCGGNPTPPTDRYYSLVLAADDEELATGSPAAGAGLVVGPISLPTYLSGRSLAMQTGPNEIIAANHHFWAEPLADAIAKVLVKDISRLAGHLEVTRHSSRNLSQGNCRVELEFDKFHPTTDGRIVTGGTFWVVEAGVSQGFEVESALTSDGYASAVAELRNALRELARQIVHLLGDQARCVGTAVEGDTPAA